VRRSGAAGFFHAVRRRKMGQQHAEDAKKFGLQGLLKDLIHVIDTLDLALTSTAAVRQLPHEQARQELETFHEAMQVLEKDLHKALGTHGVTRMMPPEGDDFNPNAHNALYTAPHEQLSKNKISKVSRVAIECVAF
jgi:molecular chaperone GrpE